jgi:hypothetical protein
LLLDEQAAMAMTAVTSPTRRSALLLVLTFVQASRVNG